MKTRLAKHTLKPLVVGLSLVLASFHSSRFSASNYSVNTHAHNKYHL